MADVENTTLDRGKNSAAFRTIGEVSAELNLPPHVLRFWESKFPQIKPQKRRGGHRYYRPVDIETVKEIKSLLHDRGFTIKGAQKYLKDQKNKPADEDNTSNLTSTPYRSASNNNKKDWQNVMDELLSIKQILQH